MPPKNPVFDAARGRASPELIESLFSAPGAYWDKGEYWTLNPTRGDGAVGSFSINGNTGMWADFASSDKGDLIGLLVACGKAASKTAAAELIVKALGGALPGHADQPARSHLDAPKVRKHKAIIPVPEDKLPLLSKTVKDTWASEHHGKPTAGYTYRNAEGGVVFCVSRFAKPDGGKDIVPYFFGEDGRWHEGQALETGRPLYKLDQIAKADNGVPILVVEGEKCAAVDVAGYLVTTWAGGALATAKTDWAPLEGRTVVVWPDADEPGTKAAKAILNRLPGAKMLDIQGRPKGWDIADALASGIDPSAFIASCPTFGGPPPSGTGKRPDDGCPFLALGYDKAGYYFLPKSTRVVFPIKSGTFFASQAQELAPLAWWGAQSLIGDKGGLKAPLVMDYLTRMQHEVGFFDPERIRGAGVWRDAGGIVLNDGRRIVTMDRKSVEFNDYASAYYYVPSSVVFGEMHGAQSTDDDGRRLEALFKVQGFMEESQATLLLGWTLISVFAGILTWRPHGWLTGRKGTGKSWIWENLIVPICGRFAFTGSGKDSEAGIRWALDQDARPALFAEAEGKTAGSLAKIKSILELARNSSDNSSGKINISQAGGGTKNFHIRSMFLFQSTMIPDEDSATTSRIQRFELRAGLDGEVKRRESRALLDGGLMDDTGRFRRRIFHALPRIIADIEYIRSHYRGAFPEQRAVDQIAPLIAAAWAIQSSSSVQTAGRWIEDLIAELAQDDKHVEDDEDTFMKLLLSRTVKSDENKTRTVAELLRKAGDAQGDADALALLERHGITLRRQFLSDPWTLYIATNWAAISAMMKDTPYASGYGAQVRRHKLSRGGNGVEKTLAGVRARCQEIDWTGFRALYLEERAEDTEVPF